MTGKIIAVQQAKTKTRELLTPGIVSVSKDVHRRQNVFGLPEALFQRRVVARPLAQRTLKLITQAR